MGGKGPKSRQKSQMALTPLYEPHKRTKLHSHDICRGPGQTHAGSLTVSSVSVSFYEPWLVDSVGFLDPSDSYNSFLPLLQDSPSSA